MKNVSKEEFLEFIRNYQPSLTPDCWGVCEPPLVTYNDFSKGESWPNSVVASYHQGENDFQIRETLSEEERIEKEKKEAVEEKERLKNNYDVYYPMSCDVCGRDYNILGTSEMPKYIICQCGERIQPDLIMGGFKVGQ